ncbi:MAG TPA: hypothetical protein QF700_04290 [Prochlorococcus sp.]|nr:hypothetical protein [Prochlorococcus sp.]|tara:strand:- start:354 stop:656 length:303 start_codon:yes stop_codon:yes gene_type:complete
MLSRDTRLRLQEILGRVASNQPVSLSERIYIHKFADRNQTVASWLNRARRMQQRLQPRDGIDQLLDGLDLGSSEPDNDYCSDDEDLGEWFGGAPSWLGRS